MVGAPAKFSQTSLWFSADAIKAGIDRIKQKRAFGVEIEDGHLAELDAMARRLKQIAERYDSVFR